MPTREGRIQTISAYSEHTQKHATVLGHIKAKKEADRKLASGEREPYPGNLPGYHFISPETAQSQLPFSRPLPPKTRTPLTVLPSERGFLCALWGSNPRPTD